jgi:predicted phosphohydrolase
MALYAIGDLHLSFGCEGKSMDIFGSDWKDHEEKVRRNWIRKIKDSDTVVLTGDHSWGKNEEQCAPDFDFIDALPGRKILLRGNHDMFWEVNKTGRLNEKYKGRFYFLQNN